MKVESIWRYPFKSMGGEQLDEVALTAGGLPGDRAYALRDGDITRNAKKYPALMAMKSWYDDGDTARAPLVELEDGRRFSATDPALEPAIAGIIGADLQVSGLAPAQDEEFYRRREKRSPEEARATFGLEEDEPFPDLSFLPSRVMEFATPPGTFFDCYPLLVMTTSSLRALQQLAPESITDVRRFRPNILIDADDEGFAEQQWLGTKLMIGDAIISLEVPCPRCVMTTVGFHDLPKDPKIMRSLVQHCSQNLGVYAEVEHPGAIRVGDKARIDTR